jgi:hypothetical protein
VSASPPHDARSRLFIPAFFIGWTIIVAGAMTALHDARDAHPFALAVHVVAFDLGHDVVLVPTALFVGWLVGRLVPSFARGPVRAGLAVSTMFVLFAYPLIKRWGIRPTNSSTLPLDYARNLTVVLVLVWLVVLATIVRRAVMRRRSAGRSVVEPMELVEAPLEDVEQIVGD